MAAPQALTIERLQRWADAGAHWRVVHHTDRHAVVEFHECTGDFVERATSDDPAVIDYLSGVESDLDLT